MTALVNEHLTGAGMKPAAGGSRCEGISIETFQVRKDGTSSRASGSLLLEGLRDGLLLSMTTMIYGMNVARSIIQEKTSRIFEVMLATAKPGDLLAGKLIGVGAVA